MMGKTQSIEFRVKPKELGRKGPWNQQVIFDWETAEADILRQFDDWRKKENPLTIFSVRDGINYEREQTSYAWVRVLFEKR